MPVDLHLQENLVSRNKMDFKDNLKLYECLSMQITSDSEMSNDELSLPRIKEIFDFETLTINTSGKHVNVKSGYDASDNCRTRQTNHHALGHAEIGTSNESVKTKPLENHGKKNQFTSVKGDRHSELKDKPSDRELADSEAERNYSPSIVDEETAVNDEGSEYCSSDTETVKDPTLQRRRTPSGSIIKVYVCSFEGCSKEFNRPGKLALHYHAHTGKRPFRCTETGCDRTYGRKQHLQRHIAVSHMTKIPHEYLKCEECNKQMKNKYNLAKHYYRAHGKDKIKCKECGKVFRKQRHLKSHSFLHTGIAPYMCEYPGCGERFMIPSKLIRHALVHLEKCYTCPNEDCGEAFDVHLDLRRHLAENHPKVCDVCGKKFRRLGQLRAHRKLHDDVREAFFCPSSTCDRYFYAERNLAKHIRDKHENTTIYQCSICLLRLSTKQKLAHHMTTHSPSYKRNYHSHKPRKPRKDKGVSRTDYAKLLSGYTGDELDEGQPSSSTVSGGVLPQVVPKEDESSSDDDQDCW